MSDVLWAAIIAGGFSAIVAVVGSVTTYCVSKRQAETAIKTAEQHASVELAKVEAELERVRREHREAERSNRQGTYQRMLAVLDRIDMYATGYPPSDQADYRRTLEELNYLVGGIRLFGAEEVRDALPSLSTEIEKLGARIKSLIGEWVTLAP